jgi:hypothetical protein
MNDNFVNNPWDTELCELNGAFGRWIMRINEWLKYASSTQTAVSHRKHCTLLWRKISALKQVDNQLRILYRGASWCMPTADHSGRAVWGMNCLRSLERWDRGFESYSRHGCLYGHLFCVCIVLYVSSGHETGWSLVHGNLPSV